MQSFATNNCSSGNLGLIQWSITMGYWYCSRARRPWLRAEPRFTHVSMPNKHNSSHCGITLLTNAFWRASITAPTAKTRRMRRNKTVTKQVGGSREPSVRDTGSFTPNVVVPNALGTRTVGSELPSPIPQPQQQNTQRKNNKQASAFSYLPSLWNLSPSQDIIICYIINSTD